MKYLPDRYAVVERRGQLVQHFSYLLFACFGLLERLLSFTGREALLLAGYFCDDQLVHAFSQQE